MRKIPGTKLHTDGTERVVYTPHGGEPLLRNMLDHYRLLLEVTRDENWHDRIAYILTAVTEASKWTVQLINEIRRVHTEAKQIIRNDARKIYSPELLDVIFDQPDSRIENLVNADIAKRETASKSLKRLAALGLSNVSILLTTNPITAVTFIRVPK